MDGTVALLPNGSPPEEWQGGPSVSDKLPLLPMAIPPARSAITIGTSTSTTRYWKLGLTCYPVGGHPSTNFDFLRLLHPLRPCDPHGPGWGNTCVHLSANLYLDFIVISTFPYTLRSRCHRQQSRRLDTGLSLPVNRYVGLRAITTRIIVSAHRHAIVRVLTADPG